MVSFSISLTQRILLLLQIYLFNSFTNMSEDDIITLYMCIFQAGSSIHSSSSSFNISLHVIVSCHNVLYKKREA